MCSVKNNPFFSIFLIFSLKFITILVLKFNYYSYSSAAAAGIAAAVKCGMVQAAAAAVAAASAAASAAGPLFSLPLCGSTSPGAGGIPEFGVYLRFFILFNRFLNRFRFS